jgi:hypothetical protein
MLSTSLSANAEDSQQEWLFVQTASAFFSTDNTLTLPIEQEVFGFTDRPDRIHAYLNAHEYLDLWKKGDDNFAANPPNAVLTWIENGEIKEAEVLLKSANLDQFGRIIQYEITYENGNEIPDFANHVSLFVDGVFTSFNECDENGCRPRFG